MLILQVDAVRKLINLGSDVNALKRGDWTPLMLASTKSGPEGLEVASVMFVFLILPFLLNG